MVKKARPLAGQLKDVSRGFDGLLALVKLLTNNKLILGQFITKFCKAKIVLGLRIKDQNIGLTQATSRPEIGKKKKDMDTFQEPRKTGRKARKSRRQG